MLADKKCLTMYVLSVQYCSIVLFSTEMLIDVDLLEENFSENNNCNNVAR